MWALCETAFCAVFQVTCGRVLRVHTAPVAAAAWLRAQQIRTVAVHVAAATDMEFAAFQRDADRPQAVVVGDLGRDWTGERLLFLLDRLSHAVRGHC